MLKWEQLTAVRQGRQLWGPMDGGLLSGSSLHVQGANGCGKTTFLRTLAGLRRPAHGRIVNSATGRWFLGHALPAADDLDALTNVRHWLALAGCGSSDSLIRSTLSDLQVPTRKPLRHLSAGQRRKAWLTLLALGSQPLWLLDEPFDALDGDGVNWLVQHCVDHLAQGGGLVFTSHQMTPAGLPVGSVLALQPTLSGAVA